MSIRPQILAAMIALTLIGMTSMFIVVEYVEIIVPACITGLVGLGMQLLKTD